MTQPEGFALGPHRNSLTGFYVLCRAVPVHTEADCDRFDSVFLEYFGGVPFEGDALGEELLNRLKKPEDVMRALRAFPDAADYEGTIEGYWGRELRQDRAGRRYVSAVGRGAGARDEKAAGKQIRKYTAWRAF